MRKIIFPTFVLILITSLPLVAAELPPHLLRERPAGAPKLDISHYDRIDAALLREGTVRVILRVTPPPELVDGFGLESNIRAPDGITRQRQAITRKQQRLLTRVSQKHAATAKRFDFIPYMALEVDSDEFSALAASPDLELIQEDSVVYPTLIQSVPLIGGIGGSFGGYTGSGQNVAILDTGVDGAHPFLAGKVVSEACYSTTYSPYAITPLCPNGQETMIGSGAGVNCSGALPGCYHGTHVAGIAAGANAGFSGVAKDAGIIAIQLFSRSDSASYCGGTAPCIMAFDSDIIAGLGRVYALKESYRIAAVNMSLGGGLYSGNCDEDEAATKAAIDALRSVGIATVIAGGNDASSTKISYPACISSAISVGATTKSDSVASYSNSASLLNLLAPGSSIYSSLPGAGYGYLSGTSMATPHVAGAWAVLKSAKPTATVTELLNALISTALPITDSRNHLVKPRIRLNAAVVSLLPPPTLRSTDPVDGATGVLVTGVIRATFGSAMKGETFTTATFKVNNGVIGSVAYDAVTATATFTPSLPLSPNTDYTATVTTGVTDAAGRAPAAAMSWSFTTQPPKILTVTSVNPAAGLSVTVAPPDLTGSGAGSTTFTRSYLPGISVTLTAPAIAGANTFNVWSGCDSYSGSSCAVTLSADRTVTATYVTQYRLTTGLSPAGSGTVLPVSGLFYPAGSIVNLSAVAAPGYLFSGWSGPVASPGNAVTTVTMDGPGSVMANFYPTVRTNVALAANGGVATASSVYSLNYPVAAVNNGDRKGVTWGSGGGWNDGTNNLYPDWVRITFAGARSIDEIDVFTLQDNLIAPVEPTADQTFTKYGITSFDVQCWDGASWVTVPGGSIRGNSLVRTTVTFPAVTTDRIRVQVNGSLGGYSRITEIEAYGAIAATNQPPTVALTFPAVGTTYVAPARVELTATASDPDGTVTRVEFYNGTTLLGSAAAAPYGFSWSSVPAGIYTLWARAYDNQGGSASSPAVTVTVTGSVARINVALAANGGVATASSVYSVNYPVAAVNNGDRKGVAWGSGGGWNDGTTNLYPDWVQITFAGAGSIDEIDVFTLQDNLIAPVEPTVDQTFTKYGITSFDVQCWDGSSWVTVPGGSIRGNSLVRTTVTFPAVTTDRIRVQVNGSLGGYSRITEIEAYGVIAATNQPPTVALTSPAVGATYVAPARVELTATASDPDGTVTTVEFYNGTTLLGSAAAPYGFSWSSVPAGIYTLWARAYDNQGGSASSSAVTVTVTGSVARTNVALAANGGVATASSVYSVNYPVAAVNNGDRKGVAWGSGGGWNDGTNNLYPDWVQITFAGARSIDEIDVFTLQDNLIAPVEPTADQTFTKYGITSFDVQCWDGSSWVTVPGGSIVGNSLIRTTVIFPAVTTDRIRVLVNSSLGGYSRITEIEAYAP